MTSASGEQTMLFAVPCQATDGEAQSLEISARRWPKGFMVSNRNRVRRHPKSPGLGQPLEGKFTRGFEGHFLLESVDADPNGSLQGVGNGIILGGLLAR